MEKRQMFVMVLKGFLLSTVCLYMTGCLEVTDQGTKEESSASNSPAQFTVPDAPTDTNTSTGVSTSGPTGDQNTTVLPPSVSPDGTFSAVLNHGDKATNGSMVHVQYYTRNWTPDISIEQYKYSWDTDCSGGTWKQFVIEEDLPVPRHNDTLYFSVQYKLVIEGNDGPMSGCSTTSIIQDDQGPQITFNTTPAATNLYTDSLSLKYSVADALSTVASVTCDLNGLSQACPSGSNLPVTFGTMPVGSYTFTITAKDNLGNQSQASTSWSVVDNTKHLSQQFLIEDQKKVDIFLVIDNSGSMAADDARLASRLSGFVSSLQSAGVDWQACYTTTDIPKTNGNALEWISKDASNRTIHTNSVVLTSTAADVNKIFTTSIGQFTGNGSGDERGIVAMNHGFQATANAGCFRSDAALAFIVISDEDERSCGGRCKTGPDETSSLQIRSAGSYSGEYVALVSDDMPDSLVSLIKTRAPAKPFAVHSIVIRSQGTKDLACYQTQDRDSAVFYGSTYESLSVKTNGLIGSICSDDYAKELAGIAEHTYNVLLNTLSLSCTPLPNYPITITLDGQPYSGTYKIDGSNLVFDNGLAAGGYTVDYRCSK